FPEDRQPRRGERPLTHIDALDVVTLRRESRLQQGNARRVGFLARSAWHAEHAQHALGIGPAPRAAHVFGKNAEHVLVAEEPGFRNHDVFNELPTLREALRQQLCVVIDAVAATGQHPTARRALDSRAADRARAQANLTIEKSFDAFHSRRASFRAREQSSWQRATPVRRVAGPRPASARARRLRTASRPSKPWHSGARRARGSCRGAALRSRARPAALAPGF